MKYIFILLGLLCISNSAFCQETEESKEASEKYQDFVDDLMGDGEEDDEDEDGLEISDDDLNALGQALDSIGSLGTIVTGAATTYKMGEYGCSQTYICMYNTLTKYADIIDYEKKLKGDKLDCKERQILIEDYILFIGTMNLDTNCIEHLHPDSNDLDDYELVDAMLAMESAWYIFGAAAYRENTGISFAEVMHVNLMAYAKTSELANPYCTEDLIIQKNELFRAQIGAAGCSCEEYIGEIDQTEKAKVLQDIRTIIDGINPIWQGQKLIELNGMLKALPCNN